MVKEILDLSSPSYFGKLLGPFWTILNHFKSVLTFLFGKFVEYFGPYWNGPSWNHFRPCHQTILDSNTLEIGTILTYFVSFLWNWRWNDNDDQSRNIKSPGWLITGDLIHSHILKEPKSNSYKQKAVKTSVDKSLFSYIFMLLFCIHVLTI